MELLLETDFLLYLVLYIYFGFGLKVDCQNNNTRSIATDNVIRTMTIGCLNVVSLYLLNRISKLSIIKTFNRSNDVFILVATLTFLFDAIK